MDKNSHAKVLALSLSLSAIFTLIALREKDATAEQSTTYLSRAHVKSTLFLMVVLLWVFFALFFACMVVQLSVQPFRRSRIWIINAISTSATLAASATLLFSSMSDNLSLGHKKLLIVINLKGLFLLAY